MRVVGGVSKNRLWSRSYLSRRRVTYYLSDALALLLLISLLLWKEEVMVEGFTPVPKRYCRPFHAVSYDVSRNIHGHGYPMTTAADRRVMKYSTSDGNNDGNVDVDVDWLVMSLSREKDDDKRRERLRAVFEKHGSEEGFADSFAKSIQTVGTSVQQVAREKAQERRFDKEASEDVSIELPQKTNDELQLWALVDMMIQMKVIVRNQEK